MDNKGFKTAGETKKKGLGKKVKKLLFLPAPKKRAGKVLKEEEAVVGGGKSGAVGHGSGAVGERVGGGGKQSVSAGQHPTSAGLRTPPRRTVGTPLSPTLRSGQARGEYAERIFLKKLKELSALGVRRRQEIKKERLAMILKNFHLGDIITNRAVRALLGISARSASRYLRQLCRRHKLVKFRADRWTFYRKA